MKSKSPTTTKTNNTYIHTHSHRYADLQPVGMGAFGLVCSGVDLFSGASVAIKKIARPFSSPILAKRTFRELRLLQHLRHENIIGLGDVFISPVEDMYFVTELLGTDLHRLIVSSRPRLERQYVQYFLYQILRGLKYVHSAGVVHRDLKPSNILVNENCDLKIIDFGLARVTATAAAAAAAAGDATVATAGQQQQLMTGYVATRYYRAPEIMLTWQQYDEAVDMWSVGCILAEMLEGQPLFPGKDHVHQFTIITELLGTPPEDVMRTVGSENTVRFVRSLPVRQPVPFTERFKNADPEAIDLLSRLLVYDPRQRLTAAQALEHPYVRAYHDPTDEPAAARAFDWSFAEAERGTDEWKALVYAEVVGFHDGGLGVGGGDGDDDDGGAGVGAGSDDGADVEVVL
ncbi:mitogen-activated protein kinase [Zopfochytrium polystomum]|nr:mitogen-activated protein kinase [Zopfochytrium polystomum]